MRKIVIVIGGLAVLTVGGYVGYEMIFQHRHHSLTSTSSTNEYLASFAGQTVSGVVFCNVEGMTCGGCVHSVQTALSRVEGVEMVQVDLSSGTAEVIIADGKSIKATELARALDDTRFKLTRVKSL